MSRSPSVDPVQVFSLNFDSHLDLSKVRIGAWRNDVTWAATPGVSTTDLMCARISRYTLEVLNLVASGKGSHLHNDMKEFYAKNSIEKFFDEGAVARVMTASVGLQLEKNPEELARLLRDSLGKWVERALKYIEN